jgi:hypothetical protein
MAGSSRAGRLAIAIAALAAMGMAVPARAAEQVTFTRDVAPILHRSCAKCHRPGDIAPMTLLTYGDVRPWARAIKNRVVSREMPPWFLDRNIGIQRYKNDPSLTDAEIATIARWIDSGAPQGNPADMPPLPKFSTGDVWDIYERLNKPAVLTAFQPHMHIRGKYQCLELIYPGQPVRTETVTCVGWNYNWHTIYNYEDDVAPLVPADTLLHVISWMDNSTANKFNPDPKNWVGDGSRTIDEMAFAWIGWYDLTEEQYKEKLAERKARQRARPSN